LASCRLWLTLQISPNLALPVPKIRGASVYENVWAENTLVGVGGETIAGSIGYDWFPNYELNKRHYYGPGDTWWVRVHCSELILADFGQID
jgi:hypothetical protein